MTISTTFFKFLEASATKSLKIKKVKNWKKESKVHVFFAGTAIGDHNSNHFRIVSKQVNDYDGSRKYSKITAARSPCRSSGP